MKKLFWISLFFAVYSCQQQAQPAAQSPAAAGVAGMVHAEAVTPDAQIDVTVQGIQAGVAKLVGVYMEQNFILDTTSFDANGHLQFKRNPSYDAGLYYIILPDFSNVQLLLDANQRFSMTTKAGDLVNSMQVSNSLENELYYKNLKYEAVVNPQLEDLRTRLLSLKEGSPEHTSIKAQQDKLLAERKDHLKWFVDNHPNAFFTKFKLAGQNPDLQEPRKADGSLDTALQVQLYRNEWWNNVDFSDDRLLHTPVIKNKLERYVKNLTPQQPDSLIRAADVLMTKVGPHKNYYQFFTNWIALQFQPTKTTVMDGEAVYVHITKEKAFWTDSANIAGLQKQAWEMESSLMNRKGPDVQAPSIDGSMKSIYEKKAPYIVVYMFNPDCEHCREQTPKLVKLYNEWKNKGLDVYAIAVNTTDKEWRDYVKEYNLPFTNVFDPTNRAIYAKYFVDITPEIYVLNPNRIIIGKNLKVEQVTTVVERDMKSPKK